MNKRSNKFKIAGIICEYNPFHNGHKYHIDKTREYADAVVCVMSGNIVQRGEFAVANKFNRAAAAVMGGADLVIELPAVFTARAADIFAFGAVSLLDSLNIIDLLSFGCECADIAPLSTVASFLSNESHEYSRELSENLKAGVTFAKARAAAISKILGINNDILSAPNNILAIEYLKWLKKLDSSIQPLPIKREFCGHNTNVPDGDYASAGYLRELLKTADAVDKFIPENALSHLRQSGGFPIPHDFFHDAIIAYLRAVPEEVLSQVCDCGEGLQRRIKAAAKSAESFEELIQAAKSKRYTFARINRIVLNAYLGIYETDYSVNYARVLAMNDIGKKLIKMIRSSSDLPVITNLAKSGFSSPELEIDIKIGDIYALAQGKNRQAGMDYRQFWRT